MLAGIQWRKSSYSGDQGGECVEVGETHTVVAVRDSKSTAGPILAFGPTTFTAFLDWATAAE
ncbi:DUF397 domain-containing protein [Streptomyces sp. uw30]|uniref:DUF397 domain-containing protein n=1 Tax=Streptomyces sp. uw30 TaxID=1828179 RepID=UPI002905EC4B|nr:DUF397 domain-containing protein [Streptomyces sp. uw30]